MLKEIGKKIFPRNSEKNSLTNQAEFIEQDDTVIPPRAANATKELEGQSIQSKTNDGAVPGGQNEIDRNAIIAKSRELVEHKIDGPDSHRGNKPYSSPLMASTLEQPKSEIKNQNAVPFIKVNNEVETMDSELINREYITNDEILYTQSNQQQLQQDVLSIPSGHGMSEANTYPTFENGDGAIYKPGGEVDIDEEAEIAAMIEQLEQDPYADATELGKDKVSKTTSVKVVYDHAEFIDTATYQFQMPISIFLDAYDMEISTRGYFSAKDINGTYVTVNPNKCYTIEIYE